MAKYDLLRERALANFEQLLDFWQIQYRKISADEYDFLNPTRDDKNYGACRFNIKKGTGADFAGTNYTSSDFKRLGLGFTEEDFAGLSKGTHGRSQWGFDIIGLCQRLNGLHSYSEGAKLLTAALTGIRQQGDYVKPDKDAKDKRENERSAGRLKSLKAAERTWSICKSYIGTEGETYLRSRKIYGIDEPNIRFHNRVYNSELKAHIPALLFKVSKSPDGPLEAIHRIYIAKDGSRKAFLTNPKKALGDIKGAGIWFGKPSRELCIVEGPETSLAVRCLGFPFVVSTISATNYANLIIPDYVCTVKLMPDPDEAGKANAHKALREYGRQKKELKLIFPPSMILSNGKLGDWNDLIMGQNNATRQEATASGR